MNSEQTNFEDKSVNQKKSSSGCFSCFGCFGSCVFVVIAVTLFLIIGGYYFIKTHGKEITADQIDRMSTSIIDASMSDEKLKNSLKLNIKNFTNKIRNDEIDLTTVVNNLKKLENDGMPLKLALFVMYGESLDKNSSITADEQKDLKQVIYGLRNNNVDFKKLASFTQILQTAQSNQYDNRGRKKLDKNKIHQAMTMLKDFIKENNLEDPGDKFNIEELVTEEVNKVIKILSDGKNAITGKTVVDVMEKMESKNDESND